MEPRLSVMQTRMKDTIEAYLGQPAPRVEQAMQPLVLVKYRKYAAVFALYDCHDTRVCVFYRPRCSKNETARWVIQDERRECDADTPLCQYHIRYAHQSLLARPGVTTGLFHTLNQLRYPATRVELRYQTISETRESYEQWQREAYTTGLNQLSQGVPQLYAASREKNRRAVRLHYAEPRLTEALVIYENVTVDQVRDAVALQRHFHQIFTCCVDTHLRRQELHRLLKLPIQVMWCEAEPVECMDYDECNALLWQLRHCQRPLSRGLLEELTTAVVTQ